MLIDVSPLLNNLRETIAVEVTNAEFLGEYDAPTPDSISINASLRYIDGRFLLDGKGQFRVHLSCARCLRDCDVAIDFQLNEWYSNREGNIDEDIWMFEECTIDLTDAIMTNVLISIPTKVLCTDECLGLCPVCGINLNESECGCDRQVRNQVFDSLRVLLNDTE